MRRAILCLTILGFTLCGCSSATDRLQRGDAYYLNGNYANALREYRAAQEADPTLVGVDEKIRNTEIRVYLQRGDHAVEQRRWAEAETAYADVRRLDPGNTEVAERLQRLTTARANFHFQCGQQLIAKSDPFGAIVEFEQALTIQPDHPRAAEALARAREDKRQREAKSARALQDGQQAWAAGRREEALQYLEQAVSLDPNNASARRELQGLKGRLAESFIDAGDALAERRQWSDALTEYRKAQLYDPGAVGLEQRILRAESEARVETLLSEADRAFDSGDWRGAFRHYDEAWKLTQDREKFRTRYETARNQFAAQVYGQGEDAYRAGRIEAALTKFEAIQKFHPGYRDIDARCNQINVSLRTARHQYQAGCRAQEARDLLGAREHFRSCANAIPQFRDVEARKTAVEDGIRRAEDLYRRAAAAESRRKKERARVLFEECLAVATPFRDAEERAARLRASAAARRHAEKLYTAACQAEDARDLRRAWKLFGSCQKAHAGYKDVPARQRRIEESLARAREVFDRAVKAEARCELERAHVLYDECLSICAPYEDAQDRLGRVRVATKTLQEARRLEKERRLLAARERYKSLLARHAALAEAVDRVRTIDRICKDLTARYEAALDAQRGQKFDLALSLARGIRKQCVGFKDIDKRIPMLESEVEYAQACAFEQNKQYEEAVRALERCAERTPEFRDVKKRLAHCRQQWNRGRGQGKGRGRGRGRGEPAFGNKVSDDGSYAR